ncbi:MAG: sulfur carrier protein ThiS [Burkholderiaceae bacterium]|jgi:sulfur carrier protein|nr:sulfur carrier protein ThiS [Burkholderiaceae bacterium]
MKILINDQPHEFAPAAPLRDALTAIDAKPPFAVALNGVFIPRSEYPARTLTEGDRIEVIRPVTGG